jgi:hypothetical protein
MADKIRVTVVFEYEPESRDYPDCKSLEDMVALDEEHNHFITYPEAYHDAITSVSYEGIPAHA